MSATQSGPWTNRFEIEIAAAGLILEYSQEEITEIFNHGYARLDCWHSFPVPFYETLSAQLALTTLKSKERMDELGL